MLQTTFNFGAGEEAVFLLNDPPDWIQPLKSVWQIVLGGAVGLSNRESRRPHSATLRCGLNYQTTRSGADARSLIGALRDLNTQPVLCPLWPGAVRWADRDIASVASELYLAWKEDWSQWEIFPIETPPAWPTDEDQVAPLLVGRIEKRDPSWISNDTCSFEVQFAEDGPPDYAVVPATSGFPDGPMPLVGYAAAPKLLPYRANFVGIDDSVAVSVLRESIGFGRSQTRTFYPQAAHRAFKLPYFLADQITAFEFLRFFRDYAGPGAAFWTPGWMTAAQLTADVAAADTELQVDHTGSLKVGDYIGLLDAAGDVTSAVVEALTETTITLHAAAGVDLSAETTILTPLLLVRLDKSAVQIDWQSQKAAAAQLQLMEVPAEYAPASDETIGQSLGQLAQRCYLYEFTRLLGGETIRNLFTSYESDVALGDDIYAAAKIEHGDIEQGIALEQDAVQVMAFLTAGHPLLLFATLKMEAPLRLIIRQANVTAGVASDEAVIFFGEIASVKLQGSKLTAKAVTAGTVFDRKIPRFYLQLACNHALFSPGCGLNKADWEFTASVLLAPSAAYPFALALHSLAGPPATFFDNWFGGGWVEFGAGAAFQRRAILNSTTVTVGALTVWLNRPFDPLPAIEDEVSLWPGCDLRAETCRAYNAGTNPQGKFDNYLNFGGHPYLPAANPSLVKLSQPVAGGKK